MVKSGKNSFVTTSLIVFIVGSIIVGLSLFNISKKNNNNEINKKHKIEIWTLYGDINNILENATKEYMEVNPNVIFEIQAFKNEEYKSEIDRAIKMNEAPDMFFTWGDKCVQEYIELGVVEDITSIYEEKNLKEELREDVVSSYTVNQKIYAIPISGWSLVLYANKDLFEANKIDIPNNYNELIEAVNRFNELGITPITVGYEEEWTLSFIYMTLALKNVGIDGVKAAVEDNKKFNEEGFYHAAEQLRELVNIRAFNTKAFSCYDSDFYFRGGDAAMTFSGTWLIPLIQREFENEESGSNEMNVVTINLIDEDQCIKGYNDSFVINKNSEEADFIKGLYADLMKRVSDEYIVEYGGGLPIWESQHINLEENKLLCKVIDETKGDEFHNSYDQILDNTIKEIHLSSIKKLFNNEITVDEFIKRHTNP